MQPAACFSAAWGKPRSCKQKHALVAAAGIKHDQNKKVIWTCEGLALVAARVIITWGSITSLYTPLHWKKVISTTATYRKPNFLRVEQLTSEHKRSIYITCRRKKGEINMASTETHACIPYLSCYHWFREQSSPQRCLVVVFLLLIDCYISHLLHGSKVWAVMGLQRRVPRVITLTSFKLVSKVRWFN